MLYPRIVKSIISYAMKYFPVVLLTGARQVGKSTLAMSFMDNYITLDDIAIYSSAKTDPGLFIQNLKKPVVIDEIQKLPELLTAIKIDVDKKRINGNFLLTGSANIMAYKNISETLAGRVAIIELLPLSCKEMAFKNENLLDTLFSNNLKDISFPTLESERVNAQIINGGYPEIQKIDTPIGRYLWFSSYIRTYIERDIRDIGELRNLDKFIKMYNILAPRSGNILIKSDIARDATIDIKTLDNYLSLLEIVYQIFILKPYSTNIGKRVVKAGKVFFTDSGVLSHLLGISTNKELLNSPYKGSLFETFVFSEILKSVKYSDKPSQIFFYRTHDRKEIDFIIEREGGIVAIEVKFSKNIEKQDFKHIKEFKNSIENFKTGYVVYMGENLLSFGEDFYALPVSALF